MKENKETQVWKTLVEMEVGEYFYGFHPFDEPVRYLGYANGKHYQELDGEKWIVGEYDQEGEKYLMHNSEEADRITFALKNKSNPSCLYGLKRLQKELEQALKKEDFEYAEILKISIEALKSVRNE